MTVYETITLAFEHHAAGRLAEAAALYRQVLAAFPNDVNALNGLGYIAHLGGNSRQGEFMIRRAIELEPNFADFHFRLAEVVHAQGRDEEAVVELAKTVQLQPDHAVAYLNLGVSLQKLNRPQEAADACQRYIELDPKNPNVYCQLSAALLALHRDAEAAKACRKALDLDPNHAGAANNLGEALRLMERPHEAATHFQRALQSASQYTPLLHNNLGITFMMQGRIDECVLHHRRSLESQPDYPEASANLFHALHYSPRADAAQIAAEYQRWAKQIDAKIQPRRNHPNSRDPSRKLRVGYVSADLRKHAVEHFIEPILAGHDHEAFEVTAYSNSLVVDETTRRLRALCDRWRDIYALSDDAAADLIAADGIDILIDLSVHSVGSRLTVFARKPAPVQMTYLGYPASTGLPAIDYRVTAVGLDLPGVNEGPEKLLALPDCYFCYQPPRKAPDVKDAPLHSAGFVTFGSCNRLSKINPNVIATWSQVLRATPSAKLQLLAIGLGEPATRRYVLEQFAAHGIPSARLVLKPSCDEAGYLAAHHNIDIALDPFPFNGGTTTLHALWMGVPVVTLAGQLPVGRMGSSTLKAAGLGDLVAESIEQYVSIATTLAADPEQMEELRRGMRARLTASPLMQAERFTSNLESLYRQAWARWCMQT